MVFFGYFRISQKTINFLKMWKSYFEEFPNTLKKNHSENRTFDFSEKCVIICDFAKKEILLRAEYNNKSISKKMFRASSQLPDNIN